MENLDDWFGDKGVWNNQRPVKHPIFATLKAAQEAGDAEKVASYAGLLYNQALLVEGMPIDDPVAFAQQIASLMK